MEVNVRHTQNGAQQAQEGQRLMSELDLFFRELAVRAREMAHTVAQIGHLSGEVLGGSTKTSRRCTLSRDRPVPA